MLAINPWLGLYIICQTRVTTVTDRTCDRKNRVRKTAIILVWRFNATASNNPMTVTEGTVRPTNSTVLPTIGQNRRSYQVPSGPAVQPKSR